MPRSHGMPQQAPQGRPIRFRCEDGESLMRRCWPHRHVLKARETCIARCGPSMCPSRSVASEIWGTSHRRMDAWTADHLASSQTAWDDAIPCHGCALGILRKGIARLRLRSSHMPLYICMHALRICSRSRDPRHGPLAVLRQPLQSQVVGAQLVCASGRLDASRYA